jgi:hypothetical protein
VVGFGEGTFVGTEVGAKVGAGVEVGVGEGEGDTAEIGVTVAVGCNLLKIIFGKKITPAKIRIIKIGGIIFTY